MAVFFLFSMPNGLGTALTPSEIERLERIKPVFTEIALTQVAFFGDRRSRHAGEILAPKADRLEEATELDLDRCKNGPALKRAIRQANSLCPSDFDALPYHKDLSEAGLRALVRIALLAQGDDFILATGHGALMSLIARAFTSQLPADVQRDAIARTSASVLLPYRAWRVDNVYQTVDVIA